MTSARKEEASLGRNHGEEATGFVFSVRVPITQRVLPAGSISLQSYAIYTPSCSVPNCDDQKIPGLKARCSGLVMVGLSIGK